MYPAPHHSGDPLLQPAGRFKLDHCDHSHASIYFTMGGPFFVFLWYGMRCRGTETILTTVRQFRTLLFFLLSFFFKKKRSAILLTHLQQSLR